MRTIIRLGLAAAAALAMTPAWAGDSQSCYDVNGIRKADCSTVVVEEGLSSTKSDQGMQGAGGGSGEPGDDSSIKPDGSRSDEDEFLERVWAGGGA